MLGPAVICCSICIKVVCVSQGFRCFPTSRGTSAAPATEKGHRYLTKKNCNASKSIRAHDTFTTSGLQRPNKNNNPHFFIGSYSPRVPKPWSTKGCSSQRQGTGSSTPITFRWPLILAMSYGVSPCSTQMEVPRPGVDGCGTECGPKIQIVSFRFI